jgi:hypothetical protein
MMKNLFVLAAALALASAAATKEDHVANGGVEVDGAICIGRDIGDYEHPSMCSKFIACASGGRAFEMPCAPCTVEEGSCPDGVLHYSEEKGQCDFVDKAGCGKPTTTTPRPPTLQPGDPCDDADNCTIIGDCHWYRFCERGVSEDHEGHKGEGIHPGFLVFGECKEEHNLYFNPELNDGVHGGSCDFWGNLSDDLKRKYNEDPDCIDPHCEWIPDPDEGCCHHYSYFHPREFGGKVQNLECPSWNGNQLLWSQVDKACLPCGEAVNHKDNTTCPC